jgi:hypothetical protein
MTVKPLRQVNVDAQPNRQAVYTMFTALKSCVFDLAQLRNLLSAEHDNRTWDDSVYLLATISNLGLGRPGDVGLVDAMVADQRLERLNDYCFRIVDSNAERDANGQGREVTINVLVPTTDRHADRRVVGSFVVNMRTPQAQLDWRIERIVPGRSKVFTIADKHQRNRDAAKKRFDFYTIFDNLRETVYMDEIGTDYLNCLTEQIEAYAGEDMRDLYLKYLAYADAILEEHREYVLQVTYRPLSTNTVKLSVGVQREHSTSATNKNYTPVALFEEILTKVGN